ncbi:RNA-guided endonuclease InsQ/TnpB family protein [Achromobacter xylosoxidans]
MTVAYFAHRIELMPNDRQRTYLARAAGTARFAYNWALRQWQEQYAAYKADPSTPKPSEMSLRRELNAVKRTEFPWMLEVTKCAPQLAIKQLGAAYQNFWAGRAKYPKPRKKGVHDRFSLSNDQFAVSAAAEAPAIRIPNLGWVRLREALRLPGKIMSATVSREADRWFVSVTVADAREVPLIDRENQTVVGVDLGLTHLATLSTGEKVSGPKALKTLLARLQRLSRQLARKVKGSANRKKARAKLARLHARIGNIRKDALHQLTTRLVREHHTVALEDLNVKGMLRNRRLARGIADAGFFELRRQLTYKADRMGAALVVVDRWFASSKLCSACGHKHEGLKLGDRQWTCVGCGAVLDRDENAARNLAAEGMRILREGPRPQRTRR